MAISELERKEIKKKAKFLEYLGYIVIREDPYIIDYQLNNICITISYPPREEHSDVLIQFIEENECFNVDWIASVRTNLNINPYQKLETVLHLLAYIEGNYDEITNIDYCRNSAKLIHEFIHGEKL